MKTPPFTAQQHCLLQLSVGVWKRRKAAKRTGLHYNEETVTEGLLLDLQVNFPGEILIVPFTKTREAQMGADWAWAFIGPDGQSNQGMLVQAKRLDDSDRNYKSLYKKNRSKGGLPSIHQIDRLINSAKRYRLPPVYAFYNHVDDESRIPDSACGSLNGPVPESWGVSFASAFKVRRAKPDKTFDCHRLHSRPLHCLLCSHGTGERDPQGSPTMAARTLSQLFRGIDEDGDELDLTTLFTPGTELPRLFREAERVYRSGHMGDREVIAELRTEFPDLAGVVLFRDNED
ncbi:MAG: hypothetical protein OXO50_05250 [Caldilineaceae bacterium]|nr:hypothetical protein [Caldilineaceae bacterium]